MHLRSVSRLNFENVQDSPHFLGFILLHFYCFSQNVCHDQHTSFKALSANSRPKQKTFYIMLRFCLFGYYAVWHLLCQSAAIKAYFYQVYWFHLTAVF